MFANVICGKQVITKIVVGQSAIGVWETLPTLLKDDFVFVQNGKILHLSDEISEPSDIHAVLRVFGGKGGFGSMLRAIGAQIEKTTNREACRDLSGRRLRDINEEKRVKEWLEKQKSQEDESEEKRQQKLERLLHLPKHEFKCEAYEKDRSDLTENVASALEEGLKKAESNKVAEKRKADVGDGPVKPKIQRKGALWLDDDISSSSDTDSSDSDHNSQLQISAN